MINHSKQCTNSNRKTKPKQNKQNFQLFHLVSDRIYSYNDNFFFLNILLVVVYINKKKKKRTMIIYRIS